MPRPFYVCPYWPECRFCTYRREEFERHLVEKHGYHPNEAFKVGLLQYASQKSEQARKIKRRRKNVTYFDETAPLTRWIGKGAGSRERGEGEEGVE